MSSEILKKYIDIVRQADNAITEARDPAVDYAQKAGEVVATLTANKSQSFTKLAQKWLRIKELEEEIKGLKAEVDKGTKEDLMDLFNAEDEVNTRVVETISFIFTLSKQPAESTTYKYADIVEALSEHLTPELIEVLEKLKEQYSTKTKKSPSLRVKAKVSEDIGHTLSSWLQHFKQWISRWGMKYDQKLNALKSMVGI